MGRGTSSDDEDELPLPLALSPRPPSRITRDGITLTSLWPGQQKVSVHAAFTPRRLIHGVSVAVAVLLVYPTPFGTGLSFANARNLGADNWTSWCRTDHTLCFDPPCLHEPVLELAQKLWGAYLTDLLAENAACWETRQLDASSLEFVSPAASFQVLRLTEGVYASAVRTPRAGAETGPHAELAYACVGDAFHCVVHTRRASRDNAFTCPLRFALAGATPLDALVPRLGTQLPAAPNFGFTAADLIRLESGKPAPRLVLRADTSSVSSMQITLQDRQMCRVCDPPPQRSNHDALHQLYAQLEAK